MGCEDRHSCHRPHPGNTDWVRSVVFSPDGTHIMAGSHDKTICVWDARTGKAIMKPIWGHTHWVTSVAFSAYIMSGSNDKTIHLWHARTGKAVMEPIRGHTITSGSSDKTIRVWDARTCKAVMEPIRGHTDSVYSVTSETWGHVSASQVRAGGCVCMAGWQDGKVLGARGESKQREGKVYTPFVNTTHIPHTVQLVLPPTVHLCHSCLGVVDWMNDS
jgi:WD40 repeat protein